MKNNCNVQTIVRRVTLFYIFANLFNVWLHITRESWIPVSASEVCCDVLLWLKHREKIGLTQTCRGKRKECFNSLLREVWVFSFDTTYNRMSFTFMEDCKNVESEILSMKFLFTDWLKSTDPSFTFNRSFTLHFVTWCIGHLANIGSLSYDDIPNNNTFHYTKFKNPFINISPDLLRKVFKYWKADKLIMVNMSF